MAMSRENVIRNAEKYVSKGKLEAAIKEYRKVLADNPNDANTLNRVGDLYARIERFDEAVKLFSQIAEQYTQEGFFVKAIAIYKKIIKLDPTSLQVYEKLAELYYKQGLLNEARTQYQVLADYYQKHDNAASAIAIFQRMAELDPDSLPCHFKLAELYSSQRLYDKALKEYRVLADLMLAEKPEEAAQVYLKAFEINHADDLDFVREAIEKLRDKGFEAAAEQVLSKAIELNPAAEELRESAAEPSVPEVDEEPPEAASTGDVRNVLSFADEGFADDPTLLTPATSAAMAEEAETSAAEPSFALPDEDVTPTLQEEDDGTFILDLEDDEMPSSLVEPPVDMDASGTGVAFAEPAAEAVDQADEEEEFELIIDGFDDDEAPSTLVQPPPDMQEPAADELVVEASPVEGVVEAGEQEIEIDWSLDEMDLDTVEPAIEIVADEAPPASFDPELEEVAAGQEAAGQEVAGEPIDAATLEEGLIELEAAVVEAGVEPADADTGIHAGSPLPHDQAISDVVRELEEPGDLEDMELPIAAETDGPKVSPAVVRQEEDLLAEAQVFSKYGLQEKARDRLQELLDVNPAHFGGLALLAGIELKMGRPEQATTVANELSQRVAESDDEAAREVWQELRAQLVEAGYGLEGEQVIAAPGTAASAASENRISQLLDDLSKGNTVSPAAGEAEVADASNLVSLVDELGLDELDEVTEAVAEGVAGAAPAQPQQDPLDETGMSWLDEAPAAEAAVAGKADEAIFDEEDDFFDLAAELQRELGDDDDLPEIETGPPQDQSLEEIIAGFKQGVAENLSPEDYDTHFNLGIAYREMGLLDEAIGEFQLASKDPRYLVDSSSLLGMCFLEKGIPELALKWYRKGLEAPSVSEETTLGLLYDMGSAYLSLGDSASAYTTFVEIYGINSNYRDVSTKIQELNQQQ